MLLNADAFRFRFRPLTDCYFSCDVCDESFTGRFLHMRCVEFSSSIDVHETCDVAHLFEAGNEAVDDFACASCNRNFGPSESGTVTRVGLMCSACAGMFADRRGYQLLDRGNEGLLHNGQTIINVTVVPEVPVPPGYVNPSGPAPKLPDLLLNLDLPRALEETSLLRLRYVGTAGICAIYVLCDGGESPVWAFPDTRYAVARLLFNTWRGFQAALAANRGSLTETLSKPLKEEGFPLPNPPPPAAPLQSPPETPADDDVNRQLFAAFAEE